MATSGTTLDRPNLAPPIEPPAGHSDDGRGGDGHLPRKPMGPPGDLSRLGTWMLLASILMLFSAFLSVYVIIRFSAETWPPPGIPKLPPTLWWSTVIILLSSLPAQTAMHRARHGAIGQCLAFLALTLAMGLGFCILQVEIWRGLSREGLALSNLFGTNFYCLTGLHAVHVLGGVIYLVILLLRGLFAQGQALSMKLLSNGILYWHFVGLLWLALFVAIYVI